jgi:hypothetical protein
MAPRSIFPAAIALAMLVLSGCLGAGIIHPKEDRETHFSIQSKFRSHLFGGQQSAPNPNKSELTAAWGKPDRVIPQGPGTEIWRYPNGFNWHGVVLMIGIPIPLMLPLSRSYTEVYFAEDKAEWALTSYGSWSGGCLCPDNEGSMRYGFRKLE